MVRVLRNGISIGMMSLERCLIVVPGSLVEPARSLSSVDSRRELDECAANVVDAATRAEVETMAMRAVMERERNLGREPSDVSGEDRGYDIESRDPDTE